MNAVIQRMEEIYSYIKKTAVKNTEYAGDAVVVGGMIGIVFFPVYFYLWGYLFPQPYESFWVRLFGVLFCIPLALYKKWPMRLKLYLPLYWHVTVIYCLPFFATYMLIKNDFSTNWLVGQSIGFFLVVILFIDWLIIILMYAVGILLAWILISFETGDSRFLANYIPYIPMFTFAVFAGFICNFYVKRNIAVNDRLQAMFSAGTNIAHELRTPLAGLRSGVEGIKNILPALINAYKKADESGLEIEKLNSHTVSFAKECVENIIYQVEFSNEIINSLLINTNSQMIKSPHFEERLITECINAAIDRYPFKSGQKEIVHIDVQDDFLIKGSVIVMIQVLHNLIRNAFYYISKAGEGSVIITVCSNDTKNMLLVRDTGTGIKKSQLKHVFKRFYSNSFEGTGIGLAFCKDAMQTMQGEISCDSVYGQYTEFILSFPKVVHRS